MKLVSYLMNRQIKSLETAFLHQGGIRERMRKARIEYRKNLRIKSTVTRT
ncbi:MAG TPA: hypothetical protein DD381_12405 [Lentisphaeria bacterium]|nr:hypothetical protein [Lentisphaeria bacterium]